jgi:hypothetical protein
MAFILQIETIGSVRESAEKIHQSHVVVLRLPLTSSTEKLPVMMSL